MKINQILKEYEVPDTVDATDTDTYTPPSRGFAIRVKGPLGNTQQVGTPAATLWYGLSAVFPNDYPPANFQSIGQQMGSPQAIVLNTIRREGSAVVKSGIASKDLAETLANKLASYGPHPSEVGAGRIPMSQIQVISQDLEEGVAEDDAGDVEQRMIAKIAKYKEHLSQLKKTDPAAYKREMEKRKTSGKVPPVSTFEDQGVAEGTAGLPDPNNFDSDNDYYDALDAYGKSQDNDADYENMADEPDDWFDESREKVGNMDADAFDAALARMKKLAGAGPLKTVYDPTKRVYKNVPTAVQPAQQPRKK